MPPMLEVLKFVDIIQSAMRYFNNRHHSKRTLAPLNTRKTCRNFVNQAMAVLASQELLLLICDFQQGIYHICHPLRRLGCYTLTIPPTRDMEEIHQIDMMLAPWYAYHSYSRMSALVRSTDSYRHNLIASHAAFSGNLSILCMIMDETNHECYEAKLIDWASCHGHLPIIQYVHKRSGGKCHSTSWAMDIAATNGHLATVQWLYENLSGGYTIEAIRGATKRGQIEVLKWFSSISIQRSKWNDVVQIAARYGHLDVVQWLHSEKRPWTGAAIQEAKQGGHFEVAQWLETQLHKSIEIPLLMKSISEISNRSIITKTDASIATKLKRQNKDMNTAICRSLKKKSIRVSCTIQ